MKQYSTLIVLLLFTITGFGQNNFPRDTSFNVNSAYRKIHKKFPHAEPVKQFVSDQFLSLPNQVYRVREDRTLRMDVFVPNKGAKQKRPVIMMIHGGGWRSGDKSHLVPLAQKLAMDGYVTASVEQRLSAEALYPAAVYDLKEAIRFLKHNSELYGIDTTKIAVLGTSSGATMASLMATTGGMAKFDDPESVYPENSSKVQALINMDGVIDFTDPNESGKDSNPDKPSAAAMFFGATYKEKPELWIEASAINYINEYNLPTLYINSALPRFHAGRDTLFDVLKKKNIYYEVHTIENTPHPYWLFHPWFDEAYGYVRDFMDKVF
ncbi:alpha/beta hydrolase [Plebeiibacterium sediminum]|uniref:Alpha/beta hydrolase n=1 Tax=Plebeiibacterium sediminum TaxID=2992112 RepID=A0AAE3SFH5_9BACT|nr:alpha/beta hydrolase [Plebeiobacterium sediminum]MCW3787438.1 alpha/beta hydrolase [Plebeiobacterium sediminum]